MSVYTQIDKYTLDELLRALEREHPGYDCTMSQCSDCSNGARCLYCSGCLTKELARRVGRDLAAQFSYTLSNRAELSREVSRLKQRMLLEAAK